MPNITPPHDLERRCADLMERELQRNGTAGAAVALLRDGAPLLLAGFGHSDLAARQPLSADALFYVYSVTKPMIATVVLQLVEQGEIGLEDAARRWLPDIPLDPAITVRQLLRHTAGLRDYGPLPAYSAAIRADPAQPWTAEEYLAAVLPMGPAFLPGQGWGYSNVGYLLLRLLVERVTGSGSLRAVLAERIFGPLGLAQSYVAETLADAAPLTPGFSSFLRGDAQLEDVHRQYHPGWVAHGVVVSTAAELAQIVDAIFDGRLFGAASRAAMLEPALVGGAHHLFRAPAYGLGVMLDAAAPDGLVAGHGGGGPGYSIGALQRELPGGRRVTAVVMANSDRGDLGLDTAFELAALLAAEQTA